MKNIILFLSFIILSGCSSNVNDDIYVTEHNNPSMNITSVSSPQSQPSGDEQRELSPQIEYIDIEYFIDSSFEAVEKTSESYPTAEIERIANLCVDYYMTNNPLVDEHDIPNGLSNIRIYELSGREDLIVISGEEFFLWPSCFMFSYKNDELILFPDRTPFEEGIYAEEIRLFYGEGFPYPLVEVFVYSHRNNGGFGIYRLNGNQLTYTAGGSVTGYHHSDWSGWAKERNITIIDDIGLEPGVMFDCRYENEHLTPSYEDVDGNGFRDIILSGNFQCEDVGGNIYLKQEVKRVYIFDQQQEQYVFRSDLSIRSELEEVWHQ